MCNHKTTPEHKQPQHVEEHGQFDEERAPQYDDLAHFGLTDADQRAYRATKQLFEEFGE